jgi:hypothetical protein
MNKLFTSVAVAGILISTPAYPQNTPCCIWTVVVCTAQPCGPLPDDGRSRNSYLVLNAFPKPDPQRKCDTAIYGLSYCNLYHQKSIGNGWMEIIP